jgi:hypothetical protein
VQVQHFGLQCRYVCQAERLEWQADHLHHGDWSHRSECMIAVLGNQSRWKLVGGIQGNVMLSDKLSNEYLEIDGDVWINADLC